MNRFAELHGKRMDSAELLVRFGICVLAYPAFCLMPENRHPTVGDDLVGLSLAAVVAVLMARVIWRGPTVLLRIAAAILFLPAAYYLLGCFCECTLALIQRG